MNRTALITFLIGLFAITIVITCVPSNVMAIGMSPIYREIYFEPGLTETFHFIMIGLKDGDLLVRPYAEGDLENYTTVPDQAYLIPASKGIGFSATLTLPDKLKPGIRVLRVGIQEELTSKASGSAGIVAKLGVESLIHVRVPYPAKYLEMKMECTNVEEGEVATFDLDVFNRGSKDLQEVSGYIDIFSPEHKKMGKINMNEGTLSIPFQGSVHFTSEWDTTGAEPGLYEAVATVLYDGNQTSTRCWFRVGELNIKIKSFGANDTQQGSIAKFNAVLQSQWNHDIPQVFNTVTIRNSNGEIVGTTSSETLRVGSWNERAMTIYWDTEDNEIGEYDATLLLEYENKNSTKSAKFRIVSSFQAVFEFLGLYWHMIVIIVLVLLILYQAIKGKKPRKKKRK
jgi:hypothetical protein